MHGKMPQESGSDWLRRELLLERSAQQSTPDRRRQRVMKDIPNDRQGCSYARDRIPTEGCKIVTGDQNESLNFVWMIKGQGQGDQRAQLL